MMTPPTAPAVGKPISASFFARLIAWVKSGQLIEGPNYRLRRTPNGTSLDFKTSSSSSSSRLPGLFEPVFFTREEGQDESSQTEKWVRFTYPYFMVGTRIYRCYDADMECRAAEGIYALHVVLSGASPVATIQVYSDFGDLQIAAAVPSVSIKPLFEFDENGSIKRDFRNMPTISSQEFQL